MHQHEAENRRKARAVAAEHDRAGNAEQVTVFRLGQPIGGVAVEIHDQAELDILANAEEEAAYEDLARMQIATEALERRHDESLAEPITLSDF